MVTWKHIIEGAYTLIDDESDIGKLMHDFNCTQASNMVSTNGKENEVSERESERSE